MQTICRIFADGITAWLSLLLVIIRHSTFHATLTHAMRRTYIQTSTIHQMALCSCSSMIYLHGDSRVLHTVSVLYYCCTSLQLAAAERVHPTGEVFADNRSTPEQRSTAPYTTESFCTHSICCTRSWTSLWRSEWKKLLKKSKEQNPLKIVVMCFYLLFFFFCNFSFLSSNFELVLIWFEYHVNLC